MSTMFKYRVHEVAKDFKVPTKTVTEILTEYASAPKNHMQVMTEEELDIIFEYLTQHNQMASLEELFAVPEKAEPEKKKAEAKAEKPSKEAKEPESKKEEPKKQEAAPAAAQQPAKKKEDKP